MARRKIFLASVFDDALRGPILTRYPDLIWRPEQIDRGARSIEDVCRDLIRQSSAFVALLDWRGGSELAFANVKMPVTVLEIELIQALFQRMPMFIFTLPTFVENQRLRGLVELAERWRVADVTRIGTDTAQSGTVPDEVLSRIGHIAEGGWWYSIATWRKALSSHFLIFRTLDIQFLNNGFDTFRDTFDAQETDHLIQAATNSKDHASRLAMLWAAMRQLSAVPYTNDDFAIARPLWEKALTVWVQSAAWYGLHDDSPIGLLAAINALIWIRRRMAEGLNPEASALHIHGSRGARASAYYSMAKRLWRPLHRWALLRLALHEVEAEIAAQPSDLSGYLAIRGSIYRARGHVFRAAADHEEMVALRMEQRGNSRAIGEALSELGWTYAWMLRLRKARQNLEEGIALMRRDRVDSASAAGFMVRALRKFAIVQALTLDFSGARHTLTEAQQIAREYLTHDQERGIFHIAKRTSKENS